MTTQTIPSPAGLVALALDDDAHHWSEFKRMERAIVAKNAGLDPTEYSKLVPPGNVTNNITHNVHPPSGPLGKLIPMLLIGAALLAAGAVGAWCLIPPHVSKSVIDRSKEKETITAPAPVPVAPPPAAEQDNDFDIQLHTRLIPPGGDS